MIRLPTLFFWSVGVLTICELMLCPTSLSFSPAVRGRKYGGKQLQQVPCVRRITLRLAENEDEDLEPDRLQGELNKMTEELPMFAGFDASNMDETALPIPTFTAIIVAVGSLVWTYYLFDIGINGFRE